MNKFFRYLVRGAAVLFIGVIALSPLFTELAELDGLELTPQGYIPLTLKVGLTATPSATPVPTATNTPSGPTPTPTNAPPPNLRISFIEYNPPGDDVQGEYIEVKNFGGTAQDIEDWYIIPTTFRNVDGEEQVLHDPYFFPSYILEPGELVRVWTKIDIDNPPNYYWNATTEIWLNGGDNARLINNEGVQVHNCSYEGGGQNTTCN